MRIALLALFLSGCASMPGVAISDEDRKLCETQQTCMVWTLQDLQWLIYHFYKQGYQAAQTRKGTI